MPTLERITKITAENLCIPLESVKPDSRFVADLDADSLDTVELVMSIEDEFGVEIPDDQAAAINTPADAVAWLERNGVTA